MVGPVQALIAGFTAAPGLVQQQAGRHRHIERRHGTDHGDLHEFVAQGAFFVGEPMALLADEDDPLPAIVRRRVGVLAPSRSAQQSPAGERRREEKKEKKVPVVKI